MEEKKLVNGQNGLSTHSKETIRWLDVKHKLEIFRTSVVLEVQKKVDSMVEEIVQKMHNYELIDNHFKEFAKSESTSIWSNRIETKTDEATKKRQALPEKVFIARQSYLTTMLEVPHMRSVYYICLAVFITMVLNLFLHDYVVDGSLNFGTGTIKSNLGKFHLVIGLWLCMQTIVLGLYFAFRTWARVGYVLRKEKIKLRLWNLTSVVAFVAFQVYFGYIFPIFCVRLELPTVSSAVVLLEMTRFLMKMHAFVRTNAPHVLAMESSQKKDDDAAKCTVRVPAFSKYLYFLFVPTLVYRDNYPRTKRINWRFAAKSLLEVIASLFFFSAIHERYMRAYFRNFGREPITKAELTIAYFGMMPLGCIMYLMGFYVILHAWQNFAAEVLRFADRMFYQDWWTTRNYTDYYRKWNIIVHDWLYEYIYRDLYMHVFKDSKAVSSFCVFLASAFVHEYIISYSLRFVYPVLMIIFVLNSLLLVRMLGNIKSPLGNFFLWWSLIVGNGPLFFLYLTEYYARQNCPVGDSWKDYVVPVSWSCNGIVDTR